MSKSEVNRLRSIRQYLLIGLSFLFSGGIALLAYSPSNGLTVSYGFIIALALGLNVLLIYQIQVIWTEINRRVQSEKMIQALMTKREELEKELRALYAEKEQENVDTRNADQLLEDLVSEVQGSEFQTYVDSYFQIVGKEWQLMQGLLFMRQEDDVFRKVAHYAYYSNDSDLQFVSGETLLGQVVKEGKPLYIDHVESESIVVASGTGSCMPCSVYIVPFAEREKKCNGVFELAFVKPLDEKERELLARFTERISVEIEKKA